MKIKSITVFCGSSEGTVSSYKTVAYELGKLLAMEKIQLVYGGAKIGLMGAVADGALQNGGKVIGVLPHFLSRKEIAHNGLSELILVNSMHERKSKMNELCDAVIALPGGFGTMEEFFEMLTWSQLGLHSKPMGLLNCAGFYAPLLELVSQMYSTGFIQQQHLNSIQISSDPIDLLEKLRTYQAPESGKWLTNEST